MKAARNASRHEVNRETRSGAGRLADENGYPHTGVMVFVDNELDPTTGTIRGRAKLDNHDRAFTPGSVRARQAAGQTEVQRAADQRQRGRTDQTVRTCWSSARTTRSSTAR